MPAPIEPRSTAPVFATQPLDVVRAELLALDPDKLLPVNVDVTASALLVLGAASEIRNHRAALVALCGEQMTATIDRLELLAHATLQAQATHHSLEAGAVVTTLGTEVTEIREVLLAEVRALITRKVVPSGALRELQGRGLRNKCLDVLQLVAALKADWETIRLTTGLTTADIDRAEAAAAALANAIGVREQAARSPSAALRQRAFSLMAETYDDARRMVSFLRWKDGDADQIAPSLFTRRGGNGRRAKSALVGEPAPTPAPAPVEPVTPGLPGAPPFLDDATGLDPRR